MQNTVPVSNFPAESGYLSEVCVISDLLLVALKEDGSSSISSCVTLFWKLSIKNKVANILKLQAFFCLCLLHISIGSSWNILVWHQRSHSLTQAYISRLVLPAKHELSHIGLFSVPNAFLKFSCNLLWYLPCITSLSCLPGILCLTSV